MKKLLFISNITNRVTNFSLPSIIASQNLGYEFHLAANCSGFKDDPLKYNITIHHINLNRNPFSIRNIKAYKQMENLIKKESFDVIHCNTPIGGIMGRLCGKKLKVPKIIYTAHGFHFYKGSSLINRTLFKWVEIWLSKYTDAIITMNQEDYQAAQKFKLRNNGTVYYIPGVGVNTEKFPLQEVNHERIKNDLGLKKDNIILISMGDLIRRKNYAVSIKSIARANNPKLHFLICGRGPELTSLQNLVKKLKIENQIHFLGFRTDIKELLSIADIFLFTTYQEGLPRSMMEAMSAGLPCIASKVRGNIDLIEDGQGGYLCNSDDINGFAKAINSLSGDGFLRARMGNSNLKTIKQFDIQNIKVKMKEIYIDVLGEV